MQVLAKYGLTFGRPVVPLEKFKKATLVFPSPGASFRSVNLGALARPCETKACTVNDCTVSASSTSKRMTRSENTPAVCADDKATLSESGCEMMTAAFTVLI